MSDFQDSLMRIMLISSPRSGNTWVRYVLATAYKLESMAYHNMADFPIALPENLILQIHWYREPSIQAFIVENNFQVLVIARHPLDVLLSVLHFALYEETVERWLGGNCEIPTELRSATPTSEAFLNFALSWGAENLLSISYLWWQDQRAIRVRYEHLVAAPQDAFAAIETQLGSPPSQEWSAAIADNSLNKFQALPNKHGWQGRPGLWRDLITPGWAFKIYMRHKRFFDVLGYCFKPYYLSKKTAERNWQQLV